MFLDTQYNADISTRFNISNVKFLIDEYRSETKMYFFIFYTKFLRIVT